MRMKPEFNSEKRVVAWLNRKSGDKATRERVIQLVRDVQELDGAERMRFQIPSPEGLSWAEHAGLDGETPLPIVMRELRQRGTGLMDAFGPRKFSDETAARLDSVMADFQYRPYFNLVRSEGAGTSRRRRDSLAGRLVIHMIPSGWNPPVPKVYDVVKGVWPTSQVIDIAPSNIQEAFMVQFLIICAGSGNIDRIRECQCGKWFLAVPSSKRYCREVCRKRFKVLTEDQIQRKREWRREYQKDYWKKNPSRRSNRKADGAAKSPAEKDGK